MTDCRTRVRGVCAEAPRTMHGAGGPHAARAPLIVDIKTPAHGDAMRRCSAGCRSFTAVRVAGLMEAAGPAGAADDSRPASSLAAGRCSERRP